MKRAAIIGLLTWAALAAIYYFVLRGHMRYALPAAIGAGLFMATVVGTYRISIDDLLNARRLSIDTEPRDGEDIAATGPIRVDGEPLRAPFSRRAAAIYIYEIDHDMRGSSVKDYSGFALAPSYVDAFHGPVRLAGFPRLEKFEKTIVADPRPYVDKTQFDRAGLDALRQMLTGDGDRARKDFQLTDAGVTKESRAFEQIVEPGEIVCAIGRYESGRIVSPRIVRGRPDEAVNALRWKAKQQFITATAIAIGVNIFVALPFFLSTSGATKTQSKKTSFDDMYHYHDAVRRGDLAAAQQMAAHGIPVNVPDLEGKQPLAIAGNEATAARVVANGADVTAADEHGQTVLMEQCRYGHAGIVKMLIAKGARLDDVEPRWHMSALKQAEQYQYMNIVQILRLFERSEEN